MVAVPLLFVTILLSGRKGKSNLPYTVPVRVGDNLCFSRRGEIGIQINIRPALEDLAF